DLFHIPVLNLVDNPGFAVGLEHEVAGTIRRGGEWMVAFAQVSVPLFTVLMRRSFGVAGNNFATPLRQPSVRVTWPAADVGGIPPEGGSEAAYQRQLAEAAEPVALRAEPSASSESSRRLANLRARPHTTIVIRAGWRWAVVEGSVELAGPDDPLPGVDAERLRRLLREIFTAAGGSHDNWDEYDRVMAAERRVAVLV